MKNLAKIKSILRAHADVLRERYGIVNLAVFGSVARGEAGKKSDVDVLATFERDIGLITLCSAENYIGDLLGEKADLIPREDVRPELKERIYSEAVSV